MVDQTAEHVESGRASTHNKTQDTNAAQGGNNGSTEHVFSGGVAETENIPRPPESNNEPAAGDIVSELRALLGQDVVLLPIATREH